ncbi:dihydroxyacetone kinase phosphoryl donor subunit DhaM [Leucobacter sp. UCD-THU]|jgi:phosphotransferase system enzyme I (PtsI)|uniref:dihydroxyacetone kinase phosphoryl donor subunit DhaM n=1 Tax=Leucobacter sp. UCD-THU TaxID=1292023 RepID=UPI00036722C8|nr:dihydroxyacetone kinase phosphoryl donor subunit DhaM [Leucobacter sp. UCD-THU]
MTERVGIVVVSHSAPLAEAAVALALEMTPSDPPRVVLAAGTADGGTGTDAMRVAEAIGEAAADGGGVLVLMDLGSAVLSAEMALEFADVGETPVRLTSAPIVEGLLAAVVTAAAGASLDAVEAEARGALGAKSAHLVEDDAGPGADGGAAPSEGAGSAEAAAAGSVDATVEVEVRNRDGVHARPAALIVAALAGRDAKLRIARAGAEPVRVSGPTALLALGARQGERLTLSAAGADARAVLDELAALFADGFGEPIESAETSGTAGGDVAAPPDSDSGAAGAAPPPGTGRAAAPRAGRGAATDPRAGASLGVSPGRVAGRVVRMPGPVAEPPEGAALPEGEREAESQRVGEAADAVAEALRARAARAGEEGRAILEAGAAIAADEDLREAARGRIGAGAAAPRAVWEAFGEAAEALRAVGGRTAERAADVFDVRARIVARLTGQQPPGLPDTDEPYVLVARDLAPADTAMLDPGLCLALVTEEGGPTSHTAILARGHGIPAVVAARGAWSEPGGDSLLVDGSTGELVWDPPAELLASIAERVEAPPFDGTGRTGDGQRVPLLANVGKAGDAEEGARALAEGVGLFRTEFCFLGRAEEPSVDEQIEAYRGVLAAFPGKRVVVRTLDAGSDKPLAFVPTGEEENPALGVRGLRTSWVAPGLLDRQLDAIAAAAAQERAEVAVMAPMVATVAEAADFAERARARGIEHVGVMIETPSAALLADRLFDVIDFVSLGTNDLAQYTMAADRLLGSLAALNDPWQPAVVELIARAGSAGAAVGGGVGVCGEAASDPLLAAVLVGAGATSLSMAARAIPAVAAQLRETTLEQCRQAAEAVVAARDTAEARAAAAAILR